jgi:RHH-type proline utilization regulon transcriptional repressor/proline dehydrogenase/delta 1-pyrroline-5-carboxylate dehydrogenase
MPRLLGLLVREAGKTLANAIAEVREAVDFLRYYAAQARSDFSNDTHHPLGPVVCISPWNFPLAIFIGQVAAALAAGNPVLAKPAEQTPLIAAEAVRVLWEAGVPRAAVQLLPGRGETVGAALVADARVQGVMFTGSTEVARILQKTLAQRLDAHGAPVPLIAETGGQNAMIVDSSALVEQVVADVMASAFDSAGQRCSALRVLCVQEEAADRVVEMLQGRHGRELHRQPRAAGGGRRPGDRRRGARRHRAPHRAMRAKGRKVFRQGREHGDDTRHGTFVTPTLIELDSIGELQREVFGPVLHLVRYRRRDSGRAGGQINGTGYGLTLGVHTRIDETIAQMVERAKAGNMYVNRNMVGAVVGVQPFGGEGLSGTGPKAGGPLYMLRMLSKRPDDVMAARWPPAGDTGRAGARGPARWAASSPAAPRWPRSASASPALSRSGLFAHAGRPDGRAQRLHAGAARSGAVPGRQAMPMPMPTGWCNWPPCCPWAAPPSGPPMPGAGAARIAAGRGAAARGDRERLDRADRGLRRGAVPRRCAMAWLASCRRIAARPGPIVGVRAFAPGDGGIPLESLVVERALSINTAAAGGNASLMTIG